MAGQDDSKTVDGLAWQVAAFTLLSILFAVAVISYTVDFYEQKTKESPSATIR